jgi:SAM-dependent methyltransferase
LGSVSIAATAASYQPPKQALPGDRWPLYARAVPVALRHDPAREEAELRRYLGDDYEHRRLQQSDFELEREFADIDDEAVFYRRSRAYLYNLTVFAMSPTKLPYLRGLTRQIEPGARVLDYGCGIGSDGLMLLEAGYRVEFADFDNPSAEYLRWRLAERGLEAPIHDLDSHVPGGYDAAYSFDVIEHVPDPESFLGELESRADLVAVNLLEPTPGDIDLHHDLPVRRLARRIAGERRILSYRIYHSRSHLLIYSTAPAGPVASRISDLRVLAGRARRCLRAAT